MISSEILSEAVKEENIPGAILSLLNNGLKKSLHQTKIDESIRDGMDIALCSIELQNSVVKYAGANRPLWLIRNGKTEIEEYKPTKEAIGGLTEYDCPFETHTIDIQPGDTFYIFSDGYADQDGGEKGKKLMQKNFKQLLMEIQNKTMSEQEKYLDDYINQWRGEKPQLDDILVIGIRL